MKTIVCMKAENEARFKDEHSGWEVIDRTEHDGMIWINSRCSKSGLSLGRMPIATEQCQVIFLASFSVTPECQGPISVVICVVTGRFVACACADAPGRKCLQGPAFDLEANVGVMLQHLPRDVASNCHDRCVACLRLRQFRDSVVAKIAFTGVATCRLGWLPLSLVARC